MIPDSLTKFDKGCADFVLVPFGVGFDALADSFHVFGVGFGFGFVEVK
jgi:hypothetical protein